LAYSYNGEMKYFLCLGLAFTLVSCASKDQVKVNLSLAGNRQMGVALKKIKTNDLTKNQEAAYFTQLLQKAIGSAYGSKVMEVKIEPNSPLETPDNLFTIARNQLDDLFVSEVTVVGNFVIPRPEVSPIATEPTPDAENPARIMPEHYVEFAVSIFNGSNLRAVNLFSYKVDLNSPHFEADAQEAFRKASIAAFPNPNIYPKSDPKHFAELLYDFSEARERENTVALTCDNAPARLKYYAAAKTLYDIALSRGTAKAVGTQSESHQITSRLAESGIKAKIVDDCIADQSKTFSLTVNYGSIIGQNQAIIAKVIKDSKVEALLAKYADKPATMRFQVEGEGKLNLFVDVRFDRARYKAWTLNQVPQRLKNFQILSLDPYHALMQKLVMIKGSIPPDASLSLKAGFESMKILLNLSTLINGEVSFAVDGKIGREDKRINMAYPNAVYISLPGFDRKIVQNRDLEIFREKGWIALGNCKTIEGAKTEDGLVYDFFGLPCQ
jgi:hypothetical protein